MMTSIAIQMHTGELRHIRMPVFAVVGEYGITIDCKDLVLVPARTRRTLKRWGRWWVVTHLPTGTRASGPVKRGYATKLARWYAAWGPRNVSTLAEVKAWAKDHPEIAAMLREGLNPGMLLAKEEARG